MPVMSASIAAFGATDMPSRSGQRRWPADPRCTYEPPPHRRRAGNVAFQYTKRVLGGFTRHNFACNPLAALHRRPGGVSFATKRRFVVCGKLTSLSAAGAI